MLWLATVADGVFVPLTDHPDYDVVADLNGKLAKVQVKTSTCWRNDRYEVSLATRGGNQSWSGRVKVLDQTRCDYLFVHVGDGRRWFIPTNSLGGCTHIVLGGPKYSEFEIDSGQPLESRPKQPSPLD